MECKRQGAEAAEGPAECRHKQRKEKKLKTGKEIKLIRSSFPDVIQTTVR